MAQASGLDQCTVFTVGHSTRTLAEFVEILHGHGVRVLADVRTIPRSRHNPQFNQDELAVALPAAGINYVHLKGLGGLRHTTARSPNTGWRNESFRGYADYMSTEDFARELDHLMELARSRPLAIMCAEAVPWRCHRSLIADALAVRGIEVQHLTGRSGAQPHRLTPFARVEGVRITYPDPALPEEKTGRQQ